MPLTKLWLTNPEQLENKSIKQIIAFAGDGKLQDQSEASSEFRDYLSHVPFDYLNRYAIECLKEKFDESGFALQDVVNEVGKRIGFEVENGRYRGIVNQIGFDGLWQSKDGYSLLVEVKTTDVYRIDLNSIADYRKKLINEKKIFEENSAILIVVGRSETGDLEAQIRGSRYAWNIRLISIEALLWLMKIKEDVEDPQIIKKVSSVLIPREYTKLDSIIELVFSTTEEAQKDELLDRTVSNKKSAFVPASFHDACIRRVEIDLKKRLVKQTRSTYRTADGKENFVCAISREHEASKKEFYWYAFHPYHKEFLSETINSYVIFGCGSEKQIILIPFREFNPWIEKMYKTTRKDSSFYWHVHIFRTENKFELHFKAGNPHIDLTKFLL